MIEKGDMVSWPNKVTRPSPCFDDLGGYVIVILAVSSFGLVDLLYLNKSGKVVYFLP